LGYLHGAVISSGRAFFLKHVGFPFLNSIVSWERALNIFEKEGEKVLSLARSMEKDKLFERVLVPKLFGLEDNSRYYSVAMVVEHLLVVGTALQNRIPMLSQGKSIAQEIKIEDYKPYTEIDDSIIEQYEIFLHGFRKEVEGNIDNIYLENRHEHPWFGELKAKDWSVMGAIHQIVHRRQIEAIIRGL
jgi:hypothetical protein